MTAAETIAKAIEKLEEARQGVGIGEWYQSFGGISTAVDRARWTVIEGDDSEEGALALVVTLHRTIDAQLAILRNEAALIVERGRETQRDVTNLATAILGGDR